MIDGILNLNKPRGITSHDAVARVRAVAGQRKVGHAGTLDPLATGVLLICLGRGTRMAEYLVSSQKGYRAQIRLGAVTDTYDSEGAVVESRAVDADCAAVEDALGTFRGSILQVPPMYSALKRDGQPLHRLARQGVTVEREPRPIEVYRLEMVACDIPDITLVITCSPGTYIRSIAHDLGQVLGCGAHLTGLVRFSSGGFAIEDAIPLDELTPQSLASALHPIDTALKEFPAAHLLEADARLVRSGRGVELPLPGQEGSLARAYGPEGAFLAVLEYRPADGVWHPRKVFHPL